MTAWTLPVVWFIFFIEFQEVIYRYIYICCDLEVAACILTCSSTTRGLCDV
jgi:hypothetical protein